MRSDSRYQSIQTELNEQFLKDYGQERGSAAHQDFMYGTQDDASTVESRADKKFAELYGEDAKRFQGEEHVKAYADIHRDPAYQELQKDILARTNQDSAVRNAQGDAGEKWHRANIHYEMQGHDRFVDQFPEKAHAYAEQWESFARQHPEVNGMHYTAQLEGWAEKNKVTLPDYAYRRMALTLRHRKERAELDRQKQAAGEKGEQLQEIRNSIGSTETEAELSPVEETANLRLQETEERLDSIEAEWEESGEGEAVQELEGVDAREKDRQETQAEENSEGEVNTTKEFPRAEKGQKKIWRDLNHPLTRLVKHWEAQAPQMGSEFASKFDIVKSLLEQQSGQMETGDEQWKKLIQALGETVLVADPKQINNDPRQRRLLKEINRINTESTGVFGERLDTDTTLRLGELRDAIEKQLIVKQSQ